MARTLKIESLKRRASTPRLKAYFWTSHQFTILPGPIFFFLCESSVLPVCDFGHLQEAPGERLTLRVTQDVPFVCQESMYFLWGKSVFFCVGNTLTKMWFFVGRPLMRYTSASRWASRDAHQAVVLGNVESGSSGGVKP